MILSSTEENRFDWHMTIRVEGSSPYQAREVELKGLVWAPRGEVSSYGIEAIRRAVGEAARQMEAGNS